MKWVCAVLAGLLLTVALVKAQAEWDQAHFTHEQVESLQRELQQSEATVVALHAENAALERTTRQATATVDQMAHDLAAIHDRLLGWGLR